MRRIGAHVSSSGGLDKAVERIVGMGGNCMQIFSGSPMVWGSSLPDGIEINRFNELKNKYYIKSVYIHAKYLINLGSPKAELVEKSIQSLKYDLKMGEMIGASGVIVHLGSHMGKGFSFIQKQLVNTLKTVLQGTSDRVKLLIENSAGQKGKLCSQLSEIKLLMQDIDSNKLGWCLDTCHAWGAGFSFGKDMENTLIQNDIFVEAKRLDLLEQLDLIHVNDSRDEFNSGHDRHANLGEGKMGLDWLRSFVNYPAVKELPLILETPGFDGLGPDKQNLEILKSICV